MEVKNMPLPHERSGHHGYEKPPHEEIMEIIERKFEEINSRLDNIEAKIEKYRR